LGVYKELKSGFLEHFLLPDTYVVRKNTKRKNKNRNNDSNKQATRFFKAEVHLNNITKFRFQLKENTARPHYQAEEFNDVSGNRWCSSGVNMDIFTLVAVKS
jgi:ribosomal protein L9